MRREIVRSLACLASILGLSALSAEAQNIYPPSTRIPDINKRSGLLTRFQSVPVTNLPSDPHRDNFYGTRFGDYKVVGRSNSMLDGGLYGLPLSQKCTSSVFPYFLGSPGGHAGCADCKLEHRGGFGRLARSFVHPFKPVGMYYQQGSYVPIYDLSPFSPGPGPDLWPHFIQTKDDGSAFGH